MAESVEELKRRYIELIRKKHKLEQEQEDLKRREQENAKKRR